MLGKLQPKETLLLYGGSGGIGTLGIGWAKAMDTRIIVTASGKKKNALCYDLGADLVIDVQKSGEKDFSEHIQEFTCGKGCDVILDPLGGNMLQQNINNLSHGGRLVLLSFLEDSRASLNMARVLLKRLQILGGTVRGCLLEEKQMIANKLCEKIWPLLEEGKIAPVIDNIYNFDEAMEAHTRMRRREHFGKMLLLTKYSG